MNTVPLNVELAVGSDVCNLSHGIIRIASSLLAVVRPDVGHTLDSGIRTKILLQYQRILFFSLMVDIQTTGPEV